MRKGKINKSLEWGNKVYFLGSIQDTLPILKVIVFYYSHRIQGWCSL